MNRHDVIYAAQTESFSTLVPIADIHSQEYLGQLQKAGYMVGYTAESFLAEHPTIDPSKICALRGITVPHYYWDPDTLIIFPIHMYGTHLLTTGNRRTLEDYVAAGIKTIGADIAAGDFNFIQTNLSDQMRIEYLRFLYERGIAEDFYPFFCSIYMSGEYGCSCFGVENMRKLFSEKTSKQKSATKRAMRKLPEAITIYRGVGDRSAPLDEAFSWTTDPGVAMLFAVWNAEKSAAIYEARVQKEQVVEYLTDRGESEILALPEHIHDVQKLKFIGTDDLELLVKCIAPDYQEYRDSADFDSIPFLQKVEYHDKGHAIRTMFLCLLMAEIAILPDSDRHILAEAALYHDVGREDCGECSEHGRKSAELYQDVYPDADPLILFLMEYHCRPDEEGLAYLEKTPELKDKKKARQLFNIFKDADGLERLRLGARELDFRYLRTPEGRALPLVASWAIKHLEIP